MRALFGPAGPDGVIAHALPADRVRAIVAGVAEVLR